MQKVLLNSVTSCCLGLKVEQALHKGRAVNMEDAAVLALMKVVNQFIEKELLDPKGKVAGQAKIDKDAAVQLVKDLQDALLNALPADLDPASKQKEAQKWGPFLPE